MSKQQSTVTVSNSALHSAEHRISLLRLQLTQDEAQLRDLDSDRFDVMRTIAERRRSLNDARSELLHLLVARLTDVRP